LEGQLINPNWHVVMVHYPMALLTLGVAIEILAFLWKRSGVRVAARWMIFLGALACLPAALTGVYAFEQVAKMSAGDPTSWQTTVQSSIWEPHLWEHMRWHIWLTGAGGVLALVASLSWLAASDPTRQRLHAPVLLVLVVAVALLGVGAWYAGEAVYTMGLAVTDSGQAPLAAQTQPWADRIRTAAPPMQAHLLAAGFVLAISLAATAATLRRWSAQPPATAVGDQTELELDGEELRPAQQQPAEQHQRPAEGVFVPPARFWLLTALGTAAAATAALWHSHWDWEEPRDILLNAQMRSQNMVLFWHLVLGAALLLLPLLLAVLTRASRGMKLLVGLLALAVLAAGGLQVWVGIKLLYGL